jgi:hypothetical protein
VVGGEVSAVVLCAGADDERVLVPVDAVCDFDVVVGVAALLDDVEVDDAPDDVLNYVVDDAPAVAITP